MPVAFHPRVWLNGILPLFYPVESRVLSELIAQEDEKTRVILETQLKELNLVQRSKSGRVIDIYYIRFGVFNSKCSALLPNRSVTNLGAVKFHVDEERVRTARVIAVGGQLFSMQFDRPITDIRASRHVTFEAIERAKRLNAEHLAVAPVDYMNFVSQMDHSAEFGAAVVLRPSEVQTINLDGGDYLGLAEIPDLGMIGAAVERPQDGFYLLQYDGQKPCLLAASFRDALEIATRRQSSKG